jgi:hypothetical protein
MLTFDVRSNLKGVVKQLQGFEKEVTMATAKALTFTAEVVQASEIDKMKEVFDRPTPFTTKGLFKKTANTRDLTASVYFKDFAGKGVPAGRYLLPQIEGGERKAKSTERRLLPFMSGYKFAMPGQGAALNAYGNMSGSTLVQIMAQIGVLNAGDNETLKSKARNKRQAKARYFIPPAGSPLKPGVYRRDSSGIKPMLIFTSKAQYKPRFSFYSHGLAVAERVFPEKYDKAIEREMRKAFSSTPHIS